MKKFIPFAAISVILLVLACNGSKKLNDEDNNEKLIGDFVVFSLEGTTISEEVPVITFKDETKEVNGKAGCNSFFGTYTFNEQTLNFGVIASTEMYCGEEIMNVENALFSALSETGSYTLKKDLLILFSKSEHHELLKAIRETTSLR